MITRPVAANVDHLRRLILAHRDHHPRERLVAGLVGSDDLNRVEVGGNAPLVVVRRDGHELEGGEGVQASRYLLGRKRVAGEYVVHAAGQVEPAVLACHAAQLQALDAHVVVAGDLEHDLAALDQVGQLVAALGARDRRGDDVHHRGPLVLAERHQHARAAVRLALAINGDGVDLERLLRGHPGDRLVAIGKGSIGIGADQPVVYVEVDPIDRHVVGGAGADLDGLTGDVMGAGRRMGDGHIGQLVLEHQHANLAGLRDRSVDVGGSQPQAQGGADPFRADRKGEGVAHVVEGQGIGSGRARIRVDEAVGYRVVYQQLHLDPGVQRVVARVDANGEGLARGHARIRDRRDDGGLGGAVLDDADQARRGRRASPVHVNHRVHRARGLAGGNGFDLPVKAPHLVGAQIVSLRALAGIEHRVAGRPHPRAVHEEVHVLDTRRSARASHGCCHLKADGALLHEAL